MSQKLACEWRSSCSLSCVWQGSSVCLDTVFPSQEDRDVSLPFFCISCLQSFDLTNFASFLHVTTCIYLLIDVGGGFKPDRLSGSCEAGCHTLENEMVGLKLSSFAG